MCPAEISGLGQPGIRPRVPARDFKTDRAGGPASPAPAPPASFQVYRGMACCRSDTEVFRRCARRGLFEPGSARSYSESALARQQHVWASRFESP